MAAPPRQLPGKPRYNPAFGVGPHAGSLGHTVSLACEKSHTDSWIGQPAEEPEPDSRHPTLRRQLRRKADKETILCSPMPRSGRPFAVRFQAAIALCFLPGNARFRVRMGGRFLGRGEAVAQTIGKEEAAFALAGAELNPDILLHGSEPGRLITGPSTGCQG